MTILVVSSFTGCYNKRYRFDVTCFHYTSLVLFSAVCVCLAWSARWKIDHHTGRQWLERVRPNVLLLHGRMTPESNIYNPHCHQISLYFCVFVCLWASSFIIYYAGSTSHHKSSVAAKQPHKKRVFSTCAALDGEMLKRLIQKGMWSMVYWRLSS